MRGLPLTAGEARKLRMRAQCLAPNAAASSVADACRAVVGLQAQSWPAVPYGVRARTRGLTIADLESAQLRERTVVRTWAQRGTLHLVATEDLGWLLGLIGPHAIARDAKRRLDLGIDEATYAAAVGVMERLLSDGPTTRVRIEEAFVRAGVPLEPRTQASIHVIQRAALEGRVCYGPEKGREKEIVLLRDWVDIGPALDPDVALAELARRYLAAFGPAGVWDFAKWSALPMPACRRAFAAIGSELAEVSAWGATLWAPTRVLEEAATGREADTDVVRLLGAFDTYLIGYRDRRQLVERPEDDGRVWHGGLISPIVLVGGRVAATWKPERNARETVVRVTPIGELDPALVPALEAEAADVGRFLGVTARLVVEPTPES